MPAEYILESISQPEPRCTAIVLAAGSGSRMKSAVRKQFLSLQGYPLVWYSLKCFQESPLIDDIILVTGAESLDYCQKEIIDKYGFTKVRKVTPGGAERYDSVYAGLLECRQTEMVLIHDSARPFVTEEMIRDGLAGAALTGAAVIGVPSKDTVKMTDQDGFVNMTPPRSSVWIIHTPQIFRASLIRDAHEKLRMQGMEGITDDAMVVEKAFGTKVRLVMGSYRNIKVTTPEDLVLAESLMGAGSDLNIVQ